MAGKKASRIMPPFERPDVASEFWTADYVRDWLPIRREQCAKRVSRKSRWWRSSASGRFQAKDLRRLKQLETENARLKKLVAERTHRKSSG
jgi:hypothetical protein